MAMEQIDARVAVSNKTSQSLQNTIRTLGETYEIGSHTLAQIHDQGEQIDRIQGKVDDMGRAMARGDAHLRDMERWTMIGGSKPRGQDPGAGRVGNFRGWLEMRGMWGMGWRRRWCALFKEDRVIRYYHNDKGSMTDKPIGSINLEDVKAVTLGADNVSLELVTHSKKHKFRAKTPGEGKEWQDVLKGACGLKRPASVVAGGAAAAGGGGRGGGGGGGLGGGGAGGRLSQAERADARSMRTVQDREIDKNLDTIGNLLGDLKGMALDMNSELTMQSRGLDHLAGDVEVRSDELHKFDRRIKKQLKR